MVDLFEEKAKTWDHNDAKKRFSHAIGAAMLEQIDFTDTMEIMDFGAGTGLIAGHLAPAVSKICAVDISQAMLDRLAAKPALQDKVEIQCQDILATPLTQTFDVIVSAMALHHIEDTDQLLKTFSGHLKPGGQVALADLDKEDGSFHPPGTEGVYHAGFEREALKQSLENNGFTEIRFVTAYTVERGETPFPIFLATGKLG